jgi:hypothetical protein
LRAALAGTPCRAHVDGPQILTDEISAIPDVVVNCAPIDHSTPGIAQPALIAEVMSPSSEGDDTTRKWFTYRKIPSLRHYLVLSQEKREVQVHSRAGDLWHERFVTEGAPELADPPIRRYASSSPTSMPRPTSRPDRPGLERSARSGFARKPSSIPRPLNS